MWRCGLAFKALGAEGIAVGAALYAAVDWGAAFWECQQSTGAMRCILSNAIHFLRLYENRALAYCATDPCFFVSFQRLRQKVYRTSVLPCCLLQKVKRPTPSYFSLQSPTFRFVFVYILDDVITSECARFHNSEHARNSNSPRRSDPSSATVPNTDPAT